MDVGTICHWINVNIVLLLLLTVLVLLLIVITKKRNTDRTQVCPVTNYLNDNTPDFSLLPPHIITQILSYLKLDDFKNASTVCKLWNYASNDPQIVKTLILQPKEQDFQEICYSNRRYDTLKIQCIKFDSDDCHYYNLFEKFCPFISELHIFMSEIKIHHLLKILELATYLKVIKIELKCRQLARFPGLFPIDYDRPAKNRIIKNLSNVKNISVYQFKNYRFFADLVRCANNLNSIGIYNKFPLDNGYDPYTECFQIFVHCNTDKLEHLNFHLNCSVVADDFIAKFVEIKNLNLRSFEITLYWVWKDNIYKSYLFKQFILKLRSLVKLRIYGFFDEQLSLICQHLMNLKNLDCLMDREQPISELGNLKQLQTLCCGYSHDHNRTINLDEIDKFFECKFENLRIFNFGELVTERNLVKFCENHPNLIELKLTKLLTTNLETVFKNLTKLRVLNIRFGFAILKMQPELHDKVADGLSFDSDRKYEYKITRLQVLREFYLSDLVSGISEEDVKQLQMLRTTNLPDLLRKNNK